MDLNDLIKWINGIAVPNLFNFSTSIPKQNFYIKLNPTTLQPTMLDLFFTDKFILSFRSDAVGLTHFITAANMILTGSDDAIAVKDRILEVRQHSYPDPYINELPATNQNHNYSDIIKDMADSIDSMNRKGSSVKWGPTRKIDYEKYKSIPTINVLGLLEDKMFAHPRGKGCVAEFNRCKAILDKNRFITRASGNRILTYYIGFVNKQYETSIKVPTI